VVCMRREKASLFGVLGRCPSLLLTEKVDDRPEVHSLASVKTSLYVA
jgi:hypothetical protein